MRKVLTTTTRTADTRTASAKALLAVKNIFLFDVLILNRFCFVKHEYGVEND